MNKQFHQYENALANSSSIFRKLVFFYFLRFWGDCFFKICKSAIFKFLPSWSYWTIENRCSARFAFQKIGGVVDFCNICDNEDF